MWERTLQDLIRGLRANKKDESKFIAQAVDEIRREVRSKDMDLKAGAVLKLTYLDMMGYDMSWASFPVVEVMSSPRAHLKSVGYLAAAQSFTPDTDVLMLITNSLKKDLTSAIPADVAIALNGISHVATPDLARDLSRDLIAMLNHSRAHIRKRAVVAMYRIFVKYPDAFQAGMPRLREKLEDPDPGVVATTVNVLCELARRNPQDYLALAPQLFHLLTTSSNNWMLIKIIKLFGALCPHEPRLVKKLQPPITDLISTTPAISLLYECVHTCIIGGMLQGHAGGSLARTCVTKLAAFLQDSDHNLKYIALLAMVKIVPSHPHLVAEHLDVILASVNDQDMSIRMRALDLVSAMVDPQNLQSIVQQLLSHLVQPEATAPVTAAQSLQQHITPAPQPAASQASSPSQSLAYRLLLSQRILSICSQSTYENVTDFEWYLSVLVDLAYVARADVGKQIRDQMVDIVGRVRAARRYAVSLMVRLLSDDSLLLCADEEGSCVEVLWAAGWICGEYCGELAEPHKLLPYLLQPGIAKLSPDTVAVYLQSASKIFAFWAADLADRWDDDRMPEVKIAVESIITGLEPFNQNADIEIQERAANMRQLFSFVQADLASHRPHAKAPSGDSFGGSFQDSTSDSTNELHFPKSLLLLQPLFSAYELNPVASSAQSSVPVPDGLDLDQWIVPPPREEKNQKSDEPDAELIAYHKNAKKSKKGKEKETARNGVKWKNGKKKPKQADDALTPPEDLPVETPEEKAERERRKAERMERMRDDPYYIVEAREPKHVQNGDDIDSIPVVRLDDMPPLVRPEPSRLPSLREPSARSLPQPFVVDKVGEMPTFAPKSPLSQPVSGTPSGQATPQSASSFPQYTVDDDPSRPHTPDPIKVVRAKKKGASAGKKKKTRLQEGTTVEGS